VHFGTRRNYQLSVVENILGDETDDLADVVGVRCFSSGSSNSCIGTLAAPERDE